MEAETVAPARIARGVATGPCCGSNHKLTKAGTGYELMQFIHHVVMTTCKGSINPGRLQYR